VHVPLWLALHLRAAQRCKVVRPPWLSLHALEAAIERERASEFELTPLPHFYVEIAEILLRQATEDWGSQLDATADLLEELIVVRAAKLKRGTGNVLKGTKAEGIMKDLIVPVTSIAAAEVASLRHGFFKVRGGGGEGRGGASSRCAHPTLPPLFQALDVLTELSSVQPAAGGKDGGAGRAGASAPGLSSSASASGSTLDTSDLDGNRGRHRKALREKYKVLRAAKEASASAGAGAGGEGEGER
jgi:hypothetical protein